MSFLQAVQIALERGSATTAAVGSTADVRQDQGGDAGNFREQGRVEVPVFGGS